MVVANLGKRGTHKNEKSQAGQNSNAIKGVGGCKRRPWQQSNQKKVFKVVGKNMGNGKPNPTDYRGPRKRIRKRSDRWEWVANLVLRGGDRG